MRRKPGRRVVPHAHSVVAVPFTPPLFRAPARAAVPGRVLAPRSRGGSGERRAQRRGVGRRVLDPATALGGAGRRPAGGRARRVLAPARGVAAHVAALRDGGGRARRAGHGLWHRARRIRVHGLGRARPLVCGDGDAQFVGLAGVGPATHRRGGAVAGHLVPPTCRAVGGLSGTGSVVGKPRSNRRPDSSIY
jgi:hypothetical protein